MPGTIRLRLYQDGTRVVDAPLGWQAALRLASDLLIQALLAERTLQATTMQEFGQ